MLGHISTTFTHASIATIHMVMFTGIPAVLTNMCIFHAHSSNIMKLVTVNMYLQCYTWVSFARCVYARDLENPAKPCSDSLTYIW